MLLPRALALLCTYTRLIPTRSGWLHGLPSRIITCTRQELIVQTSTNKLHRLLRLSALSWP